jgi:3-hydroxyacyl-[acyl-carrier-protein] dehydratase
MSTLSSEIPRPASPGELTPTELSQLQDTLKRCSPETLEAACQFRRTGNLTYLRPVICGVIQRYVEREFRSRLESGDSNLRLVEDLGLDSLTLMEIVVMAEDVLRISVSNDEMTTLRTIGDVQQFITSKVSVPQTTAQ